MSDVKNFVNFSKPFIEATKDVFEKMVFTKVSAEKPIIKTNNQTSGDISSFIGMNGTFENASGSKEFKGLIAFSWPMDVYLKVASKMLMDKYNEFCEDIEDVGSEIANIVMGNAKKDLNPKGYKIDMASPNTVYGENHEVKYLKSAQIIQVTITSELGDFIFEICFQEI